MELVLANLHSVSGFRHIGMGSVEAIDKSDFDGWKECQMDLMTSAMPQSCNKEAKEEALNKVEKLLSKAKFQKEGNATVEMIDLHFELGEDQCIMGWAIMNYKQGDQIHIAYSEAGHAWKEEPEYKMDWHYWTSADVRAKLSNFIQYEAYAQLAKTLGHQEEPIRVLAAIPTCPVCGVPLDLAHKDLHICQKVIADKLAAPGDQLFLPIAFVGASSKWKSTSNASFQLTEVGHFMQKSGKTVQIVVCTDAMRESDGWSGDGKTGTIKDLLTYRAQHVHDALKEIGVKDDNIPVGSFRVNDKPQVCFVAQ